MSEFEELVDVGVRAEKRCTYARGDGATVKDTALWDLVFETDPPTTARAGARTPLVLGGLPYEVWVSGIDEASFSIHRLH